MEKCKICGNEYKNVAVHVRTKHKLSKEEYSGISTESMIFEEGSEIVADDAAQPVVSDPTEEKPDPSIVVTPAQQKNRIFDGTRLELTDQATVAEYCAQKGLSFQELNDIVRRFTKGSAVDVTAMIDRNQKVGMAGAEKVAGPANLETTDLNVAEALQTKYGYSCVTVRGPRGVTPKTWVLTKT